MNFEKLNAGKESTISKILAFEIEFNAIDPFIFPV